MLLWLGYSDEIEGTYTKVRGRALVSKFYVSDSKQDALIHMDTTSYIYIQLLMCKNQGITTEL